MTPLGALILALFAHDVWVTVVSATTAGGPVTRRVAFTGWRALRWRAGSPHAARLAAAGPLVLATMMVTWALGLWLGWTLVLAGLPDAIVDSATGASVTGWASTAYFAGFALFTLGVGDLVPVGAGAQLATIVASLSGLVLVTLTVSYLIPVTGAVTARRELGTVLHGLGETAEDVLVSAWNGRDLSRLEAPLQQLTSPLAQAAQIYLSYPVVHVFHDPHRRSALEPGVAALHEVVIALDELVAEGHGIDPVTLRATRDVLARFAEVLATAGPLRTRATEPPDLDRETLRAAGIPLREPPRSRTSETAEHRRVMAAMLEDACWPWERTVIRPREAR